jgi:nucleoside-diphosphate-sugar epimerase
MEDTTVTKVLVVGGAGYIGGAVTELLVAEKTPFTVFDSLVYEPHYLKKVDFIRGDVRDFGQLLGLLKNYSHVVWLAAIVGDGACEVNRQLTMEVNQEAVQWLAENYHGRIVFTSTCSVYGQYDAEVHEESPVQPLSLYAKTKLEAEGFLQAENSLVFRLGTAFGVPDTYSRPRMDLVVNYMTTNALTKGELTVFGGTQWRPLVHVKDIAQAIVHNLERPVRGVYNLAAQNLQIKDLAALVSQMTGCKIKYTEQQFQDERNYHVSTKKALRDGIFNPYTMRTVQDGVREISELVGLGRIKQTENDVYFNMRYAEKLKAYGQFA